MTRLKLVVTNSGRVGVALAAVAGGFSALQAFLNGRLAGDLGSATLAASVNNAVALSVLLLVAVATGAPGRLARGLRTHASPRWWHVLGGGYGAAVVILTATVAPKVGIAALTVALVCGQSVGSLLLDRIGFSPSGRRPFARARVLGVALALLAVVLRALDAPGKASVGFLALGVVAGAAFALQQMSLGFVAKVTGEAIGAAAIIVGVSTLVVVPVALAATGGSAPNGWSAPPGVWLGGLLGAAVAALVARTAPVLGALRLALALVAGQSVGALVIDVLAPARGAAITGVSVISVVLTFAAVVVSGRRPSRGVASAEPSRSA